MATPVAMAVPACRSVRPSGSDLAPRWRGRLHLGALVASVPAAAILVSRDRTLPVLVYAVGLISLYAVSTSYHLLRVTEGRRSLLRRADHVMIYLFTAAAYTPFCVRVVRGELGTVVLALVWAGAIAGAAMKLARFERAGTAGSVLYLLIGWLGVVTLPHAASVLSTLDMCLLLAMAVFYTAGAAVLFTRRPDPVPHLFGYHEVWHAAVVAASVCYFAVVWGFPGARG